MRSLLIVTALLCFTTILSVPPANADPTIPPFDPLPIGNGQCITFTPGSIPPFVITSC